MALTAHTNFVSPLYSANNHNEYRASIQLRLDGLSYAIIAPHSAQLMQLTAYYVPTHSKHIKHISYSQAIAPQLGTIAQALHGIAAEQISIVIDSPLFTVTPSFLVRSQQEAYQQLSFAHTIEQEDALIHYNMYKGEQLMLMAIGQTLKQLIENYWPQAQWQHPISVLHHSALQSAESTPNNEPFMLAYVSERSLFIMAYQNKQLQLCNSYSFSGKEDFIYFILLAYERLQMDTQKDKLYLLGNLSKQSQLYDICWQYVRHIDFWPPSKPNSTAITDYAGLPAHQYHILTHANLCE